MFVFTALVREPGLSFAKALSEHPDKNSIDLAIALKQHEGYVKALQQAGGNVEHLPIQNQLSDSTFVEDTAIVLENKFLLCPMKELSRQAEVQSTANVLETYRDCITIDAPATLDGGDVLDTPDTVYVGLSKRTNVRALQALSKLTTKKVVPVAVTKGLHLKSAATFLGDNLLILDPTRVDASSLKRFDWVELSGSDSYSANCLALGNTVLMPAGFPKVLDKIQAKGRETIELEMSEFEKADGGLTCLSLIIPQ